MTFFGFQFACKAQALGPRRGLLADIARAFGQGSAGTQDMRALWSRSAPLLVECAGLAELGFWDLVRGGGETEYEDWTSGLEAMAGWSHGDFGSPEPRAAMALVSAVFLVETDSNADRLLGDRCDLPENRWMARETFRRMAATPPMLNLAGVRGCGLYLAPGNDTYGFDPAVLRGEGFNYLLPVE